MHRYATTRIIVKVLLIVHSICWFQLVGCTDNHTEKNNKKIVNGENNTLGIDEAMQEKAIRIAVEKAKEFEYDTNSMEIKVSTSDNQILIEFYPKQANGEVIVGGGLTVVIASDSMEISEVKRWQ